MKASETKFQPIIEGTKQYVVPLFQRPYSRSMIHSVHHSHEEVYSKRLIPGLFATERTEVTEGSHTYASR
jgi:hypothetical protein